MKKLFTILAVMTAVVFSAKAERLLVDSFPQNAGDLTLGSMQDDMGTDQAKWYYTASTTAKIQVVDTALTFPGYCSNKSAKAIQFKGNTNKAVRGFSVPDKTTSIYYSVLMNVHEIKNSTTKDAIIMMHNASSISVGYCWAQLRYLNDYAAGTYSLGISKTNETGVRWITGLPKDSTILVVVRYDIKEGDKNDEVYMWINPTKMDESKPTSWCVQDTANTGGTVQWGANQKVDASSISRIQLKPAAHTPNMHLDEIRVATKWADLFEGGGKEPAISVNTSLSFGQLYQGTTTSKSLSITAQALTKDVTISNTNKDITLSTASFSKDSAMAGATLGVTLTANTPGEQVDTITIASDTIVKKVVVSWTSYAVAACANIAALKDSAKLYEAYQGLFRLDGEAVVTRDVTATDRELYLQDATGAVKLFDYYGYCGDNLVGAKVKGFILNNGEEALGILPFVVLQAPTTISTGNTVEPQVVTLSELQTNATDYLYELVKIKGVTFTDAGGNFAVGQYAVSQATETVNIKVENNNIVGKEIPAKAHVTGFCFNTSGSVILPRNIDDIKDANPELLKNGSFEKWTEKSAGMFGKNTDFEGWNTPGILYGAKVVDSASVVEGKYALKTTSDYKQAGGYIYQELNCEDYNTGDEFKVRVNYKNLNQLDSALVLDCYWESSISGAAMGQTDEMKQELAYSAEWKKAEFTTTKPEGAKYFYYKIKIKKGAQVMLDDCAFTYQENTTTTAVKSVETASPKARKFIYQGVMYIERDGVIYNILGGK